VRCDEKKVRCDDTLGQTIEQIYFASCGNKGGENREVYKSYSRVETKRAADSMELPLYESRRHGTPGEFGAICKQSDELNDI